MSNFFIFLLILTTAFSYAEDLAPKPRKKMHIVTHKEERKESPENSSVDRDTSIGVSGNFTGMNYREFLPPPTDTETGVMGGANLDIVSFLTPRWMVHASVDFNFGKTRYDGALSDGAGNYTPLTSNTNDTILDGQLAGGYAFEIWGNTRLVPYIGFGTHYWVRGLTGAGAYTERYLFYYLPIGVRTESVLSKDFMIGLDLAYIWNLGGTIQVALSELSPPQKDATGSLGSAYGFRAQVPITYYLNTNFGLRLTPFFEYFEIGVGSSFTTYDAATGQKTGTASEPASSTYLYGSQLGIVYSF